MRSVFLLHDFPVETKPLRPWRMRVKALCICLTITIGFPRVKLQGYLEGAFWGLNVCWRRSICHVHSLFQARAPNALPEVVEAYSDAEAFLEGWFHSLRLVWHDLFLPLCICSDALLGREDQDYLAVDFSSGQYLPYSSDSAPSSLTPGR